MTKTRRVTNIITGLLMIIFAATLAVVPKDTVKLIVLVLGVSLFIAGIRTLIYYFTMARHMVGGQSMLFKGIILLDLGAFTMTLSDAPLFYIVLYLVGCHMVSGMIDVLRSTEARRVGAKSWKLNLSTGIINLLIGIAAVVFGFFIASITVMVYFYCAGLFYSAVLRIVSAFRRTDVVYIQ